MQARRFPSFSPFLLLLPRVLYRNVVPNSGIDPFSGAMTRALPIANRQCNKDYTWTGDIYQCSTGWPTPELVPEFEDDEMLKREWNYWEEDHATHDVEPPFRLPEAVKPWDEIKAVMFGEVKQSEAVDETSHFRQMVESLLDESGPEEGGDSWIRMGYTTAMLRNLPNKYMRDKLVSRLNSCGYKGDIDFLYLPIDFRNKCNVGYCFLNFRTSKALARFRDEFHGQQSGEKLPGFNSKKVLEVSPARVQGLHPNIVRLQGSPIMARADKEWLPILLDPTGKILDFPMVMPQAPARAAKGFVQAPLPSAGRRRRGAAVEVSTPEMFQ